ncbi:MAG: T9SS type A sorting domain-containing protein [Candidatus Zixiibacteriota bacterium]|nr:MAG: T9SS type A sorting domain-containing protein [candidate division Zixibacteria bacterium]
MFTWSKLATCVLLVCITSALALSPDKTQDTPTPPVPDVISYESYIDANTIFMFITNHGSFGWDLAKLFHTSPGYGTYYPYIDTSMIRSGELATSPLYAAGCWLAGIDDDTGDTLVAVSEYSSEFWPGPMLNGSYDPNAMSDPYYRMYKLYTDSATAHPNQDYLDYLSHAAPEQGAPLTPDGKPRLLGDQTLWGVFNDANPVSHINRSGGTHPMGIEVQLSAWASGEPGESPAFHDDAVYYNTELAVTHVGASDLEVYAWAADPSVMTGDDYQVSFEAGFKVDTIEVGYLDTLIDTTYFVWNLDNLTTAQRLLEDQSIHAPITVVEGMAVSVSEATTGVFTSFEVVANAGGELDPPVPGALATAGFPTPGNENPGSNQQVGDGLWAFHTADDGGTCGGGSRPDYDDFLLRTLRRPTIRQMIGDYDYEMRFTGSNDNPKVGGSYAVEFFNYPEETITWVPFELWRIGVGTPDDPSDDVRLVPFIIDDYGPYGEWPGNDEYGLESWGCILDETGSGDGEHSVSDGDDDPFTDWVYWYLPADDSPGESGYQDNEDQMLYGTFDGSLLYGGAYYTAEVLPRTVLVNWNAGVEPPFGQNCPEEGTVFRITTVKRPELPEDVFLFTATQPPAIPTGSEGQSIYLAYKLHNKGDRSLRDCFFSMWSDPDLGDASDDFVGCDTLDDLFYCYNAQDVDRSYGYRVPAIGFKYIYGPMVPSPGDSAYFEDRWIADHKNLGLTSFMMFLGGTDPQNYVWTYQYMNGLDAAMGGVPLPDGTTYMVSGDPVAGEGWLDIGLEDRRMLGTSGPFDMAPGDSQYVLVKMTVAQGTDRLNSITKLRAILNELFELTVPGPRQHRSGETDQLTVIQNHPNPFNPSTTISYSLPARAEVTVDIFNILGRKVKNLVSETQPAGVHSVVWDGTDQGGHAVSTGVYFYRIKAGEEVQKKKMLLLK